MALGDRLKSLLGRKPAKSKTSRRAPPPAKTALAPSRRVEMIDWAVQLHRAKAPMARGVLDTALKEFRAKPPNPGDLDALARLLRIHRAEVDLRRLMNHRDWRYLVLSAVRSLMLDRPPPEKPAEKPGTRASKVVIRR
ncbi:MAG: hypothetical protein SFV21_02700 [Rhodospirillaceae bacterium]|nr:hypothetical protein [Rhodospirillaceae bacterium]